MTTLENQMLSAILQAERYDEPGEAINCAKVAREWIRAALNNLAGEEYEQELKDWLEYVDNGKAYPDYGLWTDENPVYLDPPNKILFSNDGVSEIPGARQNDTK